MSKNIRKRRERLWTENEGKCYWCGILTILPLRGTTKTSHRDDLATLDHLRTRLDGNRQEPNDSNEERTVLACWKCNGIRGQLSQNSHQTVSISTSACIYPIVKHEDFSNGTVP